MRNFHNRMGVKWRAITATIIETREEVLRWNKYSAWNGLVQRFILLLFLANFETVTRIPRTETNVMLCMSFTASNHWLLRKRVTYPLYHMADNLNITNQSGFGRKHFETPWDRTRSGERGIEKCSVDFLSTSQKLNYRLSRSWQCPTRR